MLAQRSLGASVCLRCRLNLVRQRYGAAHLFSPSATSIATFSSFTRLHAASDPFDSENTSESSKYTQSGPFSVNIRTVKTHDQKRKPFEYKLSEQKPALRGRKGKRLRETTAPLQKAYLGEQSEVIILRDVLDKTQKVTAVEDERLSPQKRKEIQKAIEASIAGEKAVSGQEDVNKEIDKLRPAPDGPGLPAYISRERLQKIRKALKNGYTSAQLKRYIKITEGTKHLQEMKRLKSSSDKGGNFGNFAMNSGVLWKSLWREGITDIKERLPAVNNVVHPLEKATKQKMLDRILTHVWDIVITEETDNVGEMELHVEPWQLALLSDARGAAFNTPLDRIGQRRDAKIDAYVPANTIRITAQRQNAEQAAADIEYAIRSSERAKFDLKPFAPLLKKQSKTHLLELFQSKEIEIAARLSGTIIQSVSNHELMIRSLEKYATEDAKRILLAMLDLPSRSESKLLANAKGEGFLHVNSMESALPVRQRRRGYGRLTFPVSRDASVVPAQDVDSAHSDAVEDAKSEPATSKTRTTPQVDESVEKGVSSYIMGGIEDSNSLSTLHEQISETEQGSKSSRESFWNEDTVAEVFAQYGNVLHLPVSDSGMTPVAPSTLATEENSASRIFLHTLPGFSPFLRYLSANSREVKGTVNPDGQSPTVLLFKFIPSPWCSKSISVLEDFPEAGLRISITPDGHARFQGLSLTVQNRIADVLLPSNVVDVRFVKRDVLWSKNALHMRRVRDYVEEIRMNVKGNGRIRAPPSLSFSIPTWTVKNAERYKEQKHTADGKEIYTEYVFAGVEHRQVARFDLPDDQHRITYTSVEAGRIRGRRGELRLRLRRPPPTPRTDESLQKYEDVVQDLVRVGMATAKSIDDAVNNRLDIASPLKITTFEVKSNAYAPYLHLVGGQLKEPAPREWRFEKNMEHDTRILEEKTEVERKQIEVDVNADEEIQEQRQQEESHQSADDFAFTHIESEDTTRSQELSILNGERNVTEPSHLSPEADVGQDVAKDTLTDPANQSEAKEKGP